MVNNRTQNLSLLSIEYPFDPLSYFDIIFVQIVFIGEIWIRMNVASIASEYKHRGIIHLGSNTQRLITRFILKQKLEIDSVLSPNDGIEELEEIVNCWLWLDSTTCLSRRI